MSWFITANNDRIYIADKISVKLISPLKERKNSYSFPFNIPITAESTLIFELAENISAKNNKTREIEGCLVIDFIRLYGVLVMNTTKDNNYNCNFTGQSAGWHVMAERKLKDLDLGSIDISDLMTKERSNLDDFYYFDGNEKALCFPPFFNYKKSDKFSFDVTNYPGPNIINRFKSYSNDKIYYEGLPFMIPFFTLKYILDKIFNALNYSIVKNELDNILFDGLLLYSNYSICHALFRETPSDPIKLDHIKIEDSKVAFYNDSEYMYTIGALGGFIKIYDLTIPEKNNFEGRVIQIKEVDIANRKFIVDIKPEEISDHDHCGYMRGMGLAYDLDQECYISRHLPDMSIAEFIDAIQNMFGLELIPSESKKEIKLLRRKDILESTEIIDITQYSSNLNEIDLNETKGFSLSFKPVIDDYFKTRVQEIPDNYNFKGIVNSVGELPLIGNSENDIRLVIDMGQWWNSYHLYVWRNAKYGSRQTNSSTYLNLGGWSFFGEDYVTKTIGDKDGDKIEIKAAPLLRSQESSTESDWHNIPRIDIAASADFTTEQTDAGIRLCFLSTLLNGYPQAEMFNSHLSLRFDGTDGIYEKCYKEDIEWKLNRYKECKAYINWPAQLINDFAWEKKHSIKGIQILILEIDVNQKGNEPLEFNESILARV